MKFVTYTYQQIKDKIEEVENNDVLLSKEYINGDIYLEFLCHKCNNSYFHLFYEFMNGRRCGSCKIKENKLKKRLEIKEQNKGINIMNELVNLLKIAKEN